MKKTLDEKVRSAQLEGNRSALSEYGRRGAMVANRRRKENAKFTKETATFFRSVGRLPIEVNKDIASLRVETNEELCPVD